MDKVSNISWIATFVAHQLDILPCVVDSLIRRQPCTSKRTRSMEGTMELFPAGVVMGHHDRLR